MCLRAPATTLLMRYFTLSAVCFLLYGHNGSQVNLSAVRAHVLSSTSIYCMRMACLRLSVVFVILVAFVDCVIVACDLVGWHIIFEFTFKNAYDVVNGFFFEVGVFQ